MAKRQSDRRRQRAVKIVAQCVAMMHGWETRNDAKMATAKKELARLGVLVEVAARPAKGGAA